MEPFFENMKALLKEWNKDPAHWPNNKRRRSGLPVLRKSLNKKGRNLPPYNKIFDAAYEDVATFNRLYMDDFMKGMASIRDFALEHPGELSKMMPKWLYRLESTDPKKGLWYNANGEYVWTIGTLPDCQTKDLPMGYDERYRRNGRHWYSSCSNPEDLAHWFSLDDALKLMENGFQFMRYLATEYTEYPLETVFIKETCLDCQPVDPHTLYQE